MLDLAVEGVAGGRPFVNEPLRDFSQADVRERFRTAIRRPPRCPRSSTMRLPTAARATSPARAAAFDRWRDRDWTERAAMLVERRG